MLGEDEVKLKRPNSVYRAASASSRNPAPPERALPIIKKAGLFSLLTIFHCACTSDFVTGSLLFQTPHETR